MRYIFEKKAEMYFIEGRFCSKAAENFVSVLLAYNAPSICPRQNASATAYSVPNKQDGPNRTSTAVCTAAAQAMNAQRIERVVP